MSELGYPVIFDATHSVQRMGGSTGVSGGSPQFIEPLARAAVATGVVSAVFVETHPRPQEALSDKASMLPLERLELLINELVRVAEAVGIARPISTMVGK
jgi:2-dehydro-3-deoxyphosphooctonate aldolase (KDO 8-P synthase)